MVHLINNLRAEYPLAAPPSRRAVLAAIGFFLGVTFVTSIALMRLVTPAGDAALAVIDHSRQPVAAVSAHAQVKPALKLAP
mgnify:FL=1